MQLYIALNLLLSNVKSILNIKTAQNIIFYILLDLTHSANQIKAYCCSCKNGLRTVGCCEHVMSVLWYLGHARHLPTISQPAEHLNNFFVTYSDTEISENE